MSPDQIRSRVCDFLKARTRLLPEIMREVAEKKLEKICKVQESDNRHPTKSEVDQYIQEHFDDLTHDSEKVSA